MLKREGSSLRGDETARKRQKPFDGDQIPNLHDIFRGEVATIKPYGAFVKIPKCRKQGLLHVSQISKSRVEDPSELLSVGEKIHCKIISIEEDGDKIGLSMKLVNQTTGEDEDPNNVELSLDERKKKKGFKRDISKIELGAVLNTTCKKCGGRGHLAQDCFHIEGGKVYDLLPEDPAPIFGKSPDRESPKKKKKKKEKKHKHKKKHRHSSDSSDDESPKKSKAKHFTSEEKHRHKKHKKHTRRHETDKR